MLKKEGYHVGELSGGVKGRMGLRTNYTGKKEEGYCVGIRKGSHLVRGSKEKNGCRDNPSGRGTSRCGEEPQRLDPKEEGTGAGIETRGFTVQREKRRLAA